MQRLRIALALVLALLSASASAQTIEYGKDRGGINISDFSLPANSGPEQCQGACWASAKCSGWTFVRSGVQGATPRCWLKDPVAAPTDNICCVSGLRGSTPPPPPPPTTPVNPRGG